MGRESRRSRHAGEDTSTAQSTTVLVQGTNHIRVEQAGANNTITIVRENLTLTFLVATMSIIWSGTLYITEQLFTQEAPV